MGLGTKGHYVRTSAVTPLPLSYAEATAARSTAGLVIGAVAGGAIGSVIANRLGGGLARYAGIGGALAVVGALIGHRLLDTGSASGTPNGQNVGIAYGRKTIDHGDGTSEFAKVQVPLLLGARQGAAEGYATLASAIAATHPNSGNGEMAFVRHGAVIDSYTLTSPELEAIEQYRATDPSVVAYTTRLSGDLIAGPAATAEERATSHLVDAPPPPF